MEEITATVKQSADSARQASLLAGTAAGSSLREQAQRLTNEADPFRLEGERGPAGAVPGTGLQRAPPPAVSGAETG